jgi:hypothetical protein
MREIRAGVVLLGVLLTSCISPAEQWDSDVVAEVNAASFVLGDSVTVTLVNESGGLRYARRCWELLRSSSGKWLRVTTMPAITCSPSYSISAGGSIEQKIGIWSTDLGLEGTGTFRIWFTVYAPGTSPDHDGDFVSTPSFVVQNP